ncbi:MAG: PspC domain-containing protein [Microbacterium sp.]
MTVIAAAAPLVRPRRAWLGGVSEALAAHLGWRVTVVRAIFVASSAVWGFGTLLYLWLWAFVPLAHGEERVTRRAPVAWVLLGASILVLLTTFRPWLFYEGMFGSWRLVMLVPGCTLGVLALAAGLWSALLDRADPARGPRSDLVVRATATVILVIEGVRLVALTWSAGQQSRNYFIVLGFLTLLAAIVVCGSTFITRFRELQNARIAGIREEQRAEMAAHLHDSVLQTLALIQNRAGASSEVGRIARAQERELRTWLYDADELPASDLASDLRDYAVSLELAHEVAFTVVSAGESTERATGEVAAAAREAMLNAARHAGGSVDVYIEGAPGTVDVFIRDRGPGFAIADVPEDRLGVRESIVGRLRRAGGMADVGAGPGGVGTQVHIRYPAGGIRG